ncbi:MAG: co-chaperone YbbN [Pseudonocardiales bacterium]|nr:MAG: co-chaperone YbbN [Pseudonocardiales bacterium]
MSGAVDLAAIQARAEAAARAAEAPAPDTGQYVLDVTEATFQPEVLDRSFQRPVLVELFSGRTAGNQLSPTLERLARESNGSWVLVRIDVDVNPRIAQALQVQAVPTVFAVINGQLLPGYQGMLPDDELREFVVAVLAAAREAGLAVSGDVAPVDDVVPVDVPEEPEDPRLVAAEDALEAGDYALAAERYQGILDAEPANSEVAAALRQVRLFERLESIDPALAARADQAPDDLAAQLAAADVDFARNDIDPAFSRLLSLLARTGSDERDLVRQRLLEYFELLGSDDPRVAPARRELARVLF